MGEGQLSACWHAEAGRLNALVVSDLAVHFPARSGPPVRAVDGVSLTVEPGETLGLVGGERLRQVHHLARRGGFAGPDAWLGGGRGR